MTFIPLEFLMPQSGKGFVLYKVFKNIDLMCCYHRLMEVFKKITNQIHYLLLYSRQISRKKDQFVMLSKWSIGGTYPYNNRHPKF